MKRHFFTMWLLTVLVGLATVAAQTPNALTNQTVLDMVTAKLPADLIVTKIQTSPANFDLSTDALVKLNQSGVPSEVIKAMMQKSSASSTTAAAVAPVAPSDPNDPNAPHDPGIYVFYSDGRQRKLVMLEPTVYTQGKSHGVFASAVTYGIAKVKWNAVVRNAHANVHISDQNPVFYFYFEEKSAGLSHASFGGTSTPNEFTLLKFEVKKDARETAVMKMNAFGGSSGTDDKANVPFTFEKLRPGVYKVTAKAALANGEYCFLGSEGGGGAFAAGAAQASRLFDFGVVTE
ncbi:MAG TPA: hypothetical protein VF532_20445 [Candidatus Angelobacter sp.]